MVECHSDWAIIIAAISQNRHRSGGELPEVTRRASARHLVDLANPAWSVPRATDLECVMSPWWLAPEAGANATVVEDVGAVLELAQAAPDRGDEVVGLAKKGLAVWCVEGRPRPG